MHGGISKKKSCGMFTYDNLNFKPQILSIFYFDRASDGRMAHVLSRCCVQKDLNDDPAIIDQRKTRIVYMKHT